MMSASAFPTVLQIVPGVWGFALSALALILSAVTAVWISGHRKTVLLARVEKDVLKVRGDHEARMSELQIEHATRMFKLETDREKMHLEAQMTRDLMSDRKEVEFPLPFARKIERPALGAREAEA